MHGVVTRLIAAAILAVAAQPGAHAEGSRLLGEAEALSWRGVGRLNVAGLRFCTATLISETRVVTAAHCLHHPRTSARVPLDELRFVAGLRLGDFAASRRIAHAAIPDGYTHRREADPGPLRDDIALLELASPIGAERATPFQLGAPPEGPEPLTLVSYSRSRPHAPSIESPCHVRSASPLILAVDCAVTFGASGAPVFVERAGQTQLSAVIAAMARAPDGAPVALAVSVAPAIAALEAKLQAARSASATTMRRP
jgi:hypothetical protein